MPRLIILSLMLVTVSNVANAYTQLELYSGKVTCKIEQVCVVGHACEANTQFLREITFDFQKQEKILVSYATTEAAKVSLMSPAPTSDDIKWWHLAWMDSGPNVIQIGFDYEFTWYSGTPELVSFSALPPTVRTGHCEDKS